MLFRSYGCIEMFRIQFQDFYQIFPRPADRFFLEVIAERPVTKHFKHGVVVRIVSYFFQVIMLSASDVRKRLEEREKTEGAGVLFDELRDKDPEAAARMDPRNPRRTIRALEVIELTGKPYSASLPRYRYVIPSVQIGLDLDRPNLDHRIDLRTKQMYDDGFIKEVERIRPHLGATAVRALGYQQVIDLLDGIWDVNEAFADIAQKTKRLARKQMGWFGRDPRIHWLQALNPKLVDNAMAIIAHADAGDYDPIDARADEYTQHHLGDIAA